MLAPPELRAVHPLGKSPVITDDGNTVAESGAIIEYLVAHLRQRPADPAAEHAGAAALHLLAALRRRLGDAAAAAEAGVQADPKRAPALLRPIVRKVSDKALTRSSIRSSSCTSITGKASSARARGSPATSSPPPTSR